MQFIQYLQTMFAGSMSSASNIVIYIAIVVLFVMGIIRCVVPVMRTRQLIRRATRSIRSAGDKKYAWQEDEFLGKGALFAHWSDYLNNLFFADGRYHNASNVEDYINEETVIYGPGRISFAEALPGLLTSLGFLGTLIGLAQGLSGFSMNDSAAVQESIVTLIPGMRYAFMTSIFGVVGSVLFTLITRAVYGATEHTLTQFYSAMSRHAGVLSVDPMTQIAIYQQEQTALIKTMTKDLNGKFTETMAESIGKSIEPVNQTLKGFVNGISREQARLIDSVLSRFVERMNESLGGSLKRFSQILDETSRLQQQNTQAVRAGLDGLEDVIRDIQQMERMVKQMMDGMSTYVEQLNAARQQADDAYMRVNATVEQMEIVSRQESSYLRNVGALQADITGASDRLAEQLNQLSGRFAEDTGRAAAEIQKSADALAEAADRLAGVHEEAARAVGSELNTTLDAYRDYVNQFTERVDYLSSGILDAVEHMPDAIGETNNRFLDQMDALTETLEQAQKSINSALARMNRK